MSHWLQKGLSLKLLNFKLKIFLTSFFIHLIVLFFSLLKMNQPLKMQIKRSNFAVPLIFLPLQKKVPGAIKALQKKSVGTSNLKSNIKIADDRSDVKKIKTIQSKVPNKDLKIAPTSKPKICINQNKSEIKKKVVEKIEKAPQQEIQKLIKDEINNKQKIESEKMRKSETKKEEQPKQVLNDQKLMQEENEKIQNDLMQDSEAIFIGRHDLEQIKIEELLKYEIESKWKVPEGLSNKLQCTIKMFVSIDGKLQNVQIIKSSKSLAFDLSAKNSLTKIIFPKEVWNNDLILNFGGQI